MDINKFISDERPRWQRLETLLQLVDGKGLQSLDPVQTEEFYSLYRLVSSDLNLVQTRTANSALLEYLEGLVGRAYADLSVPREFHPFSAWWKIVRHEFPAAIRSEYKLLGLTAAVMLAGVLFGFFSTMVAPETAEVFLGVEHLAQTPAERVAELEMRETEGKTQLETASKQAEFSTFLFTHNIRVMVFGFALGLTFGVGTIIMLFYNGAMLGSLAHLYLRDGVMTFFIAWVGPHGSIELPCILFGCTAGLMLARAQYRRDRGTLLVQIRDLRRKLVDIVTGTATLLVIAGIIEGTLSQVNEPSMPYALKIAVAVMLFSALLMYLFVMPVKSRLRDEKDVS